MSTRSLRRSGFTLIELLVVIAIIAILMAMLVPAVQKVREAASRSQCQNNLKQLALALHSYHSASNMFPAGATGPDAGKYQSLGANLSWATRILPHIEQDNLYRTINFGADYPVQPANSMRVPLFICPSAGADESMDPNAPGPTLHYLGVMGPKGGMNPVLGQPYPYTTTGSGGWTNTGILGVNTKHKQKDVKDGMSNTILLGELSWEDSQALVVWTRGWDGDSAASCRNLATMLNQAPLGTVGFNDVSFGSDHAGVSNFAFADGSVRTLAQETNLQLLQALASMKGKEPVSPPE